MDSLNIRRVRFSNEADSRLSILKARTGITPNILCRIGFCLSLEEPSIPNPEQYPEGRREINRYTLVGEFDEAFAALLRQRMVEDNMDLNLINDQFSAHMNRGVLLLFSRVKSLVELGEILGRNGSIAAS